MNKNIPVLFVLLFSTLSSIGQSQLNISPGTTFFITNGTTVFVDGLSLTPSSNFSISAPNSVVRNSTIVNTTTGSYISRVYKWANPVSIFNGGITIQYEDAELNGITENALILEAHNGTRWMPFETGVMRNGTSNIVSTPVSNINFNELTLAWSINALPLDWGTVRAYRRNALAYVEWNTFHESNTAYFEIEKSTDGNNWYVTGTRIPAYNSPGRHQYVAPDPTATNEKTFYRIRQVDRDNQFSYSTIVLIEAVDDLKLALYPNPAKETTTIQSSAKFTALALFSADGKQLRFEKTGPVNSYTLPVGELQPGHYVVLLYMQDGTIVQQKFIKN